MITCSMGSTSPLSSKRSQRRKISSGAPLVRICCFPSGVATTTDIIRREKSKGISSSLRYDATGALSNTSLCSRMARSSTFFRPVWKWLMR